MISVTFKNALWLITNLILINWKIGMHSMATCLTLDGDKTDNGQYTWLFIIRIVLISILFYNIIILKGIISYFDQIVIKRSSIDKYHKKTLHSLLLFCMLRSMCYFSHGIKRNGKQFNINIKGKSNNFICLLVV